jgi:hypothetical protein
VISQTLIEVVQLAMQFAMRLFPEVFASILLLHPAAVVSPNWHSNKPTWHGCPSY